MAGKYPKSEQIAALRIARATRQSSRGGLKRVPPPKSDPPPVLDQIAEGLPPDAGMATGPRDSKSRHGVKALGSRGPKPGHGGRPRLGEDNKTLKKTQPWKALGMSQRTWYRRQEEKRAKE